MDVPTARKILKIFQEGKVDVRKYINQKIGAFHETLLHYYAGADNTNQNKKRSEFLIENDTDINAKDSFDKTPLHKAVISGNHAIVKLLLSNGAHVDSENAHKNTPLYNAIVKDFEICATLLNDGADPNNKTIYQETPFSRAVRAGLTQIVNLLLKHGGDVEMKVGETAETVKDIALGLVDKTIHNWCIQNLENRKG